MEANLFHRLENICKRLIEKKIDCVYLYPFGNRGMEIFDFIKRRYNFFQVIAVDNELSKYNSKVINSSMMESNIKLGNGIVLLTSDNPIIYREIRLEVYGKVRKEKILDCFEENPLIYAEDCRVAALALASKQIYNNQVKGCVAEAGVYQGEFAKYINILFPDRRLYLFDTFNGFETKQVNFKLDNIEQTNQWINELKDTEEEIVFEKMRYKDRVVMKKGIFPDSAKDVQEQFAFVNLDMDIYQPTYEGLMFFWEKMSSGGYIFIHDFDNWDGINAAVIQFCKEKSVSYICLNDRMTACIAKPMR